MPPIWLCAVAGALIGWFGYDLHKAAEQQRIEAVVVQKVKENCK